MACATSDSRRHVHDAGRALDRVGCTHHRFQQLGTGGALLQHNQSFGKDLAVRPHLFAEQVDQEIVAAGLAHRTVLSSAWNKRVSDKGRRFERHRIAGLPANWRRRIRIGTRYGGKLDVAAQAAIFKTPGTGEHRLGKERELFSTVCGKFSNALTRTR